MSRPRTVRVGAVRLSVEQVKALHAEATGDGLDGATLTRQGVILLAENLGFDQERETFLHEALHAAIDQTNLRSAASADRDEEERLVSALSPVLFGFIRDNPRVIAWLQEVK